MIKSLDTYAKHRPVVVFAASGEVSCEPPYKSIECESLNRTLPAAQSHSAGPELTEAGQGIIETRNYGHGHFANQLNQGMSPMKSNVLPFTPRKSVENVLKAIDVTDNVVALSEFKQRARLRRVATGVFFVTPGTYGPGGATAA